MKHDAKLKFFLCASVLIWQRNNGNLTWRIKLKLDEVMDWMECTDTDGRTLEWWTFQSIYELGTFFLLNNRVHKPFKGRSGFDPSCYFGQNEFQFWIKAGQLMRDSSLLLPTKISRLLSVESIQTTFTDDDFFFSDWKSIGIKGEITRSFLKKYSTEFGRQRRSNSE